MKSFKCLDNCGECCGSVPMLKTTFDKNIDKLQKKCKLIISGSVVYPETSDLKCVFLTKDKKCAIYDDRPDICKMFGFGIDQDGNKSELLLCPHLKPNGNPWSPAKKRQLQRIIKKLEKETFKKIENEGKSKRNYYKTI